MPRGSRSARVAQPDPPKPSSSGEGAPASPASRPQPKKRTVAENARAIDSLHSKFDTMSSLLTQVAGRCLPPPDHEDIGDFETDHMEDIAHHQPAGPRLRHRSDFVNNDMYFPTRSRHNTMNSTTSIGTHSASRRHTTTRRNPYSKAQPLDPLGARSNRPPRRDLPTTLHDLDDSADLQDRVAHLILATFAPPHLSGKKLFAHSYVRRGNKKSRTTLGDLSLAEYNLGFVRLMNSRESEPADRPFMFQHLEHLNEDAIMYPFHNVRAWSEEICFLVAEGELSWDDHYRIDLLRIKLSQKGSVSADQRDSKEGKDGRRTFDAGALDPNTEFSAEIRAARPAPPCRMFNSSTCTHATHHVSNGFRHLHVCSSCVYHKCLLIPHAEKDCKSKEYRKRSAAKDADAGFGK